MEYIKYRLYKQADFSPWGTVMTTMNSVPNGVYDAGAAAGGGGGMLSKLFSSLKGNPKLMWGLGGGAALLGGGALMLANGNRRKRMREAGNSQLSQLDRR